MPSLLPFITRLNETQEIGYDSELAIAYLLSLNDDEPLNALVKAYYPFKIFQIGKETRVFDLLGNSYIDIPIIVAEDLTDKIEELVKIDENQQNILITKFMKALDSIHNETIEIQGFIDDEVLAHYLINAGKALPNFDQTLFQPSIDEKKFYKIQKEIRETWKETSEVLNQQHKAEKALIETREIIIKEHEKKVKNLEEECNNKTIELEKQYQKELEDLEMEQEVRLVEIKKKIDNKIMGKKNEYNKLIQQRSKLMDKDLETTKLREKNDKMTSEINKEIDELEKQKADRIYSEKQQLESWKTGLQTTLETEKNLEAENQLAFTNSLAPVLTALDELIEKQSKLIYDLEVEEATLNTLINLDYLDGETVLVPIYIYKKTNHIGYHGPIKMVGEKNGLSLKGLIQYSLCDKIRKQVSPHMQEFNPVIEKMMDKLKNEFESSDDFEKNSEDINILTSKDNLVLLLVGLNKLMSWGWINEKEYILAQRQLVSRIEEILSILKSDSIIDPPSFFTELIVST